MYLEIVTPDKKVFSGSVTSAIFPGTEGLFGILNNHAPMISTLKKGVVKITTNKDNKTETQEFNIGGGVVEINKNSVILLADSI